MKQILFYLAILAVAIVFGICLGTDRFTPVQAFNAIVSSSPSALKTILLDIRLPRVLAAFLVGAGLALTGAVLQSLVRNPLADSYTLGISGGSLLGICFGILWGRTLAVPLLAFAGAVGAVILVLSAGAVRRLSNPTLILLGVVLNFILSSFVLFILALARNEKFQEAFFWMLGDISFFDERLLVAAAIIIPVAGIILACHSRALDVLSLGEEKAATLGLDVETVRRILLIVVSLVTGMCVSIGGMVGFVGLIIPHLVRMIFGASHRTVIPGAFILGGSFLILCDTLARSLMPPIEIPVGVITGFFGGIFFLIILLRTSCNEVW